MKKRTYRARRLALQALCCLDAQGNKVWNLVDEFIGDSDERPAILSVARALTQETFDLRQEVDKILNRHARNWDLARLAMVDRNILRLAVAEFLGGKTPAGIIFTDAMHLAQEFSTAESPRFINGVLDPVCRDLGIEVVREQEDTTE